eukprot:8821682-Heterocapsa_arctica.AAC.1
MGLDALLLEGGCWNTYSLVVIGMVTPWCEDVGPTTAWSMVVVEHGEYFAPTSVHKSKASA